VKRVHASILVVVLVVGAAALVLHAAAQNVTGERPERLRPASCPPFHLLDEDGRIINPVADPDVHIPYSPRRTCGACHDYSRITQGYHFQMGANVMADNFGAPERPWDLSDGMVGRFDHLYIRQFAKKELSGPRDFDLTAYDWVHECGVCHPGGGIMERDRDGHRYDVRQQTDTELAELLDGDYYGARWDESGVVEADCLVCHLPEGYYDYGIRVEQIRKLNYRYAATAAALLAGVAGSVSEGDTPLVVYNTRFFNVDGKVKLPIQRPTDRGCLHCHDEGFIKTRGVSFQDHYNEDLHSERGIRCTDCHPGDIDHDFAKGDSRELTLRDDLDGTMRDCEQCHVEGFLNAPKMVHRGLPEFHLSTVACTACHVAPVQLVPVGAVDIATGRILNLPAVPGAEKFGAVAESAPAYEIDEDGLIYPYNNVLPAWWGHKDGTIIYPLYLKEIEPAYTAILQSIYEAEYPADEAAEPVEDAEEGIPADIMEEIVAGFDDNGDGQPEMNTEEEIRTMLAALKTVAGRFDPIEPVYVKGNKVYELDAGGQVSSTSHPVAEPLHWALNHNVAARDKALGYNGCTDCHSSDSRFFFGAATVDPFGPDGQPITAAMHELLGYSQASLLLSAWREGMLKPATPWIVLAVVVIALLHFSLFGVRNGNPQYIPNVVRFRVHERVIHLVLMLSMVFLVITGFIFFFSEHDPLGPWARETHSIVGFVASGAVILMFLFWIRDMAFTSGDARWIRGLGGYFGGEEHLPAGKYNAGQKIFFWIAVLMGIVLAVTGIVMYLYRGTHNAMLPYLYTLHDIAALVMLVTLIGHIYLAVLVNPHSMRSLFGGKVSAIWAKKHHPDWQPPA
jgi:formate dehydrogenase gamma subunit